ncbi:MAG: hypothetical protein HON47_03350 [Candidatus Diapherotrites archaeon]|jgi:ribosomal protein S24E|uniref:Small ribosomal subunit protein eS24 n=1 Tax=Candidatus Iainarchaeum sp. TaxID=3101447 RepID=A0A8T5GEZ8_9ARCH|nr:hypothetical protein [Candidatus Diapherotrites archaeon]MBT7241158.1 hypothetical protein [Candidatus Diapherotrites archaeon]
MKIKIIQDTKNEVLNRREIVAEIEEEKIPSRNEVRAKLAAMSEVEEKTLIIEKIDSSFGNPTITVKANAYTDEESMNKIEKEYFIKRNFPVEEKKEGEEAPAAEEATTETPTTEEVKPEAPVEETKAEEVAPTKEKKEEAPATEEPKAEEVKEEAKPEEKKEDAPKEETKAEEPAKEEKKKEGEQ